MKPVVVVTGSAGTLGQVLTATFEGRDYQVVGFSRRLGADAAEEADVERVFAGLGRVDALVNNASLLLKRDLVELEAEEWDLQIRAVLRTAFLCSREAFRRMQPGGAIVNVSSLSGVFGVEKFAGMSAYVAAKSGLAGLTEALAVEGRALGIRVNAISPGAFDSPMLAESGVAGPRLSAEAVAGLVAWLATPDSAPLTGANLRLDP